MALVATASTVNFDPKAKGPIVLRTGDSLVVRLDTVSDGGFAWSLAKGTPLRVLKLQAQGIALAHPRPAGSPPIAGGPTVTTFTFRAVKSGRETLTLIYGRPWMLAKGSKPDETQNIAVIVK